MRFVVVVNFAVGILDRVTFPEERALFYFQPGANKLIHFPRLVSSLLILLAYQKLFPLDLVLEPRSLATRSMILNISFKYLISPPQFHLQDCDMDESGSLMIVVLSLDVDCIVINMPIQIVHPQSHPYRFLQVYTSSLNYILSLVHDSCLTLPNYCDYRYLLYNSQQQMQQTVSIDKTNVLILGSSMTGKTYFLNKYAKRQQAGRTTPATVGVDFILKQLTIMANKKMRFLIWDTAGIQRFRTVTKAYIEKLHPCFYIIFYDLTKGNGFEDAEYFIRLIQQNNEKQNANILMVGNMADLISPSQSEICRKLKSKYQSLPNFKFVEVSCLNNFKHSKQVIEEFLINSCFEKGNWIDKLKLIIGQVQLKRFQTNQTNLLNSFSQKIKKNKNKEGLDIINKLITQMELNKQTQRKSLRSLKQQQTTLKQKQNQINELTIRINEIEDKYQLKINTLVQQHQQEVLTLQYWLVQIDKFYETITNFELGKKYKQKAEQFHQFVISIDQFVGRDDTEIKGQSMISSSVLLDRQESMFRKQKRISLAHNIQKYIQLISDFLPQIDN